MKCDYCDGKGIKNNKRCWNCYGTGQRFEIRIEPQQPVVCACGDHIGHAERIGLSQDGAICGNCATGRSDYDARMELDTLKARLDALADELRNKITNWQSGESGLPDVEYHGRIVQAQEDAATIAGLLLEEAK